jgi:hypothetical protein
MIIKVALTDAALIIVFLTAIEPRVKIAVTVSIAPETVVSVKFADRECLPGSSNRQLSEKEDQS